MGEAKTVVVCGSSSLAVEIAAHAQLERDDGHKVIAPEFTGEQPTDEQVNAWHDHILNADEVVVVVDDTYLLGEHVKGEVYTAHMQGIPVRLVKAPTTTSPTAGTPERAW